MLPYKPPPHQTPLTQYAPSLSSIRSLCWLTPLSLRSLALFESLSIINPLRESLKHLLARPSPLCF